MAEKGENVGGEEESWEYYDDNEVLPDFWQVRYNYYARLVVYETELFCKVSCLILSMRQNYSARSVVYETELFCQVSCL